jgi:hypothetical protein
MLVSDQFASSEAAPDAAELERLHASVVVGMPMPPSAGYAVPLGALEALSQWIAAGAPTGTCP